MIGFDGLRQEEAKLSLVFAFENFLKTLIMLSVAHARTSAIVASKLMNAVPDFIIHKCVNIVNH